MGSVVAIMRWGQPVALADGERMFRPAPHRGTNTRIEHVRNGLIGISNTDEINDATLAVRDDLAVAFVGFLDNAQDLMGELSGSTSTAQPADVVMESFRRWGPECAGRLRGAFAVVVVRDGKVWCWRDQVGFRPLFYRDEPGAFLCATEAKQVLAGTGLTREPNLEAIQTVFYNGISREASVNGVKRLMAAEILEADGRDSLTRRYWDPTPIVESARLSPAEARDRLVPLLQQSVQRTLTGADAIAMSGGIDSTTIAAFAAGRDHRTFAYTYAYPGHNTVDETRYTRAAAEALGLELEELTIKSGPLDDLERWVDLADGPWDTLPIPWAVEGFKFAHARGARNILYGDLAEYVFTVRAGLLGHLFYRLRWRALARYLVAQHRLRGTSRGISRALLSEILPTPMANAYYRMTGREQYHFPQWVDPTAVGASRRLRRDLPNRKRWSVSQLSATRGTTTTLEADEIAAAHTGVTLRRPLADVDLWEFFLSLPAEIKFPDSVSKSLVRQAMRGRLPDVILDRRDKTVFDEHALATAQIERLQDLIDPSSYRMTGVDYERLEDLLESHRLTPNDVIWVHDLAKVHAFVGLFE